VRGPLKRIAERALIVSGAAKLSRRRLPRGAALVLAYHNVVPNGVRPSGDRSLHLAVDDFSRQLDVLQEMHEVVPLTSLFDAVEDAGRLRVALTFDDAYAGALDLGLGELRRRNLPATVFVAPGLLGMTPWWDLLAREHPAGLSEEVRVHALEALAGQHDRVVSWMSQVNPARSIGGAIHPSEWIASEEALRAAAAYPRLALAAHTWSHPNLSALAADEVAAELSRSLRWLRDRFPSTIPMLSYPYGLHSPQVLAAASDAGYRAAFRVSGGWCRPLELRAHPQALPRYNVPAGLSIDGFRLRLSGIRSR
jgi:peptidoglycan/xylan/chitin deacetylase (PgdA/CDA1 family)